MYVCMYVHMYIYIYGSVYMYAHVYVNYTSKCIPFQDNMSQCCSS